MKINRGLSHQSVVQRSFLFASLSVFFGIFCGCNSVKENSSASVGTATLEIDFPEGSHPDKEIEVVCRQDSTVFSVMANAQKSGELEFIHRQNFSGSPESIFVESIGGVKSVGGNFWTYYVNDDLAKQGCGTMSVRPGDKLRWVYGQSDDQLRTPTD